MRLACVLITHLPMKAELQRGAAREPQSSTKNLLNATPHLEFRICL